MRRTARVVSPTRIFLHAWLLMGVLAAAAKAQFLPDGYWEVREMEDYEKYVRIEGDSGFYCVLDNKSSFAFEVVGDSITTPWGRLDGIAWAPGSGDIIISGVEKGEAYRTRFKPADSVLYAAKCAEIETEYAVTGLMSKKNQASRHPPALIRMPGFSWDLLGRKTGSRKWEVENGKSIRRESR